MASRTHDPEPLLTPAEVASMFRVDPKTVTRWAKAGKLSAIRTLGGHRRYRESEVRALLQGQIPSQRVGDLSFLGRSRTKQNKKQTQKKAIAPSSCPRHNTAVR